MIQIADLHIHSKYSRACSKDLTLPNIDKTCRTKGVDIIATGDFTFPEWQKHIIEETEELHGSGLYKLKTANDETVKFILSTELALIYKDGGRARRIHIVVMAPNLEAVKQLNDYLDKHYNIRSDGRPILGMSVPDLMKLCLSINPKFLIFPAHIWTPWFAVFGSKSGFDTFEECFHEYTSNIFAYETGLSSDPAMNWRLSALDNLKLLSNSDAHSLPNIGREANIFDLSEITYDEIYEVLKTKDIKRLPATIEFYPEEGMYHLDGHRDCGICLDPAETRRVKGICPKCKKPLVIGVMNRVDELADREAGFRPNNSSDYIKLVELDKIIAESFGIKSRTSKKVQLEYKFLTEKLGSELGILMDIPISEIKKASNSKLAEGIRRVRAGELTIQAGFDGQYGLVKIFTDKEKEKTDQPKLFLSGF